MCLGSYVHSEICEGIDWCEGGFHHGVIQWITPGLCMVCYGE